MKKKLNNYQAKRNFNKTTEPQGLVRTTKKDQNNIFVIQHHLASKDHYDFRLEWKGILLSWAIPKGPSFNPKDKRLAIKVEDHPVDYANYEGVIPKGEYGGGTVMIWDEGSWKCNGNMDEQLSNGIIKFELFGKRLKGAWTLVKIKDEKTKQQPWLLIKEKDEYTKSIAGISTMTKSVKTNRTMKQIEKEEGKMKPLPFSSVDVQLAKLIESIPDNDEWLFEIKYDGYRMVSFIDSDKIIIKSRNNTDYTDKFPNIYKALQETFHGHTVILDGEIIALDSKGNISFQELQQQMKHKKTSSEIYMVFDILALDGNDLRNLPLIDRKQILDELCKELPPEIQISHYLIGNGRKLYQQAQKLNLEGIVGKRINEPYHGNRNGDWIKIKYRKGQEFVIGGYTIKNHILRSLLLGVYENDKLIYVGKVGTGLSEKTKIELLTKFKKYQRVRSPFNNEIPLKKENQVVYLKPTFIAEVEYAEWTKSNQLRQASFKGLREDKKTTNVIAETTSNVKITHPERLIYPKEKITKMDVINYYTTVSNRMFPYLDCRLLSEIRCHEETKNCFFKKHPTTDNIKKKTITTKDGKKEEYFYIDHESMIRNEVQNGTLEFHIWGSTLPQLEKPNMLVFDLDPDEKMDIKQIQQGAKDLKQVLDKLNLTSFIKTSGGKGYHIVVPIQPTISWDKAKQFAHSISVVMEQTWPDKYVSKMTKSKRTGKIFIDWMRNSKGATTVAPYSLRARDMATVSMPISWRNIDKIAPDNIRLEDAISLIKKTDPWKNYFAINQRLPFH